MLLPPICTCLPLGGMPSSFPVRPFVAPAHRDLVAFCDQIVDADVQIGMPVRTMARFCFVPLAWGLPGQGAVVEKIRRHEFVGAVHLLLVPDRLNIRMDYRLVVL
jgi:hypothetical protein